MSPRRAKETGLPAVNSPVLLDYSEQLAILLFGQLMKWLRPMVRRGDSIPLADLKDALGGEGSPPASGSRYHMRYSSHTLWSKITQTCPPRRNTWLPRAFSYQYARGGKRLACAPVAQVA